MNLKNLLQVSKNLNVLYIEDDSSREATTNLLLQLFNKVIVAIDGEDGLQKYIDYYEKTKEYVDIIISDLHMPRMDGIELSKNILKLNDKQTLIVTSAYNDSNHLIDLLNLGITSFLIKPIKHDTAIKVLYKTCKNIHNANLLKQNHDEIEILNENLKNSNKELEDKVKERTIALEHLLFNDQLTSLKSHFSLMNDLENSQHNALFLVNIDSFHSINNHYGFENANLLLNQFAKCLKLFNINKDYNIYRVYADEFVLYKEIIPADKKETKKDLVQLIQAINEYGFSVEENNKIDLTATIGLSIGEENPIMSASMALRHAKKHRKPYTIYENKIDSSHIISDILKWSGRLKIAIENNLILTAFQPIVNTKGDILKYEVLMRVAEKQDNNLKIISPFEFLEPAIKTRQYNSMMSLLIEKSFIVMYNRKEDFSINLSYEDIYNSTLISILKENIKKFNKISHRLIIEILETESIEDLEIMQSFIKDMRQYGVRFAIDDFGTGHSNFANIIDINPDYIKIDGSFIKNIHTDQRSYSLVKGIVNSAKDLNIKTIAEFVHNKEVFEIVKELGVDEFQGYYFSEPLLNI